MSHFPSMFKMKAYIFRHGHLSNLIFFNLFFFCRVFLLQGKMGKNSSEKILLLGSAMAVVI